MAMVIVGLYESKQSRTKQVQLCYYTELQGGHTREMLQMVFNDLQWGVMAVQNPSHSVGKCGANLVLPILLQLKCEQNTGLCPYDMLHPSQEAEIIPMLQKTKIQCNFSKGLKSEAIRGQSNH